MSRASRFATIGVIWICAIFIHYFATIYLAPGTTTAGLVEPGVGTFVKDGYVEQMYKTFVQYIPLIFIGGSLAWGLAKEYEDAVLGGYR